MNKSNQRKTFKELRIEQVAYEIGIQESMVGDVMDEYFKIIKSQIEEIELKSIKVETKEEFQKIAKIISIPNIGYLVPNYVIYKKVLKKELKTIK